MQQKGWRLYIEEFRGSEAVKGFCYEFIYGDCRVYGQRFCTRSKTSLYYSELLFRKVSPQVFFIVKLVCFIGFLGSSYLVLFIFLLHDFDMILMFVNSIIISCLINNLSLKLVNSNNWGLNFPTQTIEVQCTN